MRLEDRFGNRDPQQVVFTGLDYIESFGEQRESTLDTGVDDNALTDRFDHW
jgi:hypothetical protein